jgi:hypothetical protein
VPGILAEIAASAALETSSAQACVATDSNDRYRFLPLGMRQYNGHGRSVAP